MYVRRINFIPFCGQDDGAEVIGWIIQQPWSNGRVGLYGKSWGGFNGLQIAAEQPVGLATAISLYSTDDRYTDDVHYMGGTVVGTGMVSWANQVDFIVLFQLSQISLIQTRCLPGMPVHPLLGTSTT